MDATTSVTLLVLGAMAVIAVSVWSAGRPNRPGDLTGLARELAELDAAIAVARREITGLRDDVARLRGALGVDREDA